jgi:hypothetical protein
MLNKISGLARSLYIVLAIVAGFVALGGMNTALLLVVLGLISGISMPRERLVLAMAAVLAAADRHGARQYTAIGQQLGAVMANCRSAWPVLQPLRSPFSCMKSQWKA